MECKPIFAQLRASPADNAPNSAESVSILAERGPKPVEFGRICAECAKIGDTFGQIRPIWPGIDRSWAEFDRVGPTSANLDRSQTMVDNNWSDVDQIRANWPEASKCCPVVAKCCPTLAKTGQNRLEHGHKLAETSTNSGQIWTTRGAGTVVILERLEPPMQRRGCRESRPHFSVTVAAARSA